MRSHAMNIIVQLGGEIRYKDLIMLILGPRWWEYYIS